MSFFGSTDFSLEVAKGNIPGHSFAFVVSNNPASCTSYEDIWDAGELDTLDYDAQSGNFTPGLMITGGTSGATATIVVDDDDGATGTLTLRMILGDFQDGETITDTSTGSATTDGVLLGTHRFADYPTSGEQWEIVCESALDTVAGTGAQKVLITYLDTSYVEQSTLADTGGATPTAITPTDCLRFQSGVVAQFGSATTPSLIKSNQGGVVIRDIATKGVRGYIPYDDTVVGDGIGFNFSRSSHYTVRAGETAYVYEATVNTSKNFEADVISCIRPFGSEGFIPAAQRFIYQSSIVLPFSMSPIVFPEKSDFKFIARSTTDNVPVSGTLTLLIVED